MKQWSEWFEPQPALRGASLPDQLRRAADEQDRLADNYRGCTFVGAWPGGYHISLASLLRSAATEFERLTPPPKTPAEIAAHAAAQGE